MKSNKKVLYGCYTQIDNMGYYSKEALSEIKDTGVLNESVPPAQTWLQLKCLKEHFEEVTPFYLDFPRTVNMQDVLNDEHLSKRYENCKREKVFQYLERAAQNNAFLKEVERTCPDIVWNEPHWNESTRWSRVDGLGRNINGTPADFSDDIQPVTSCPYCRHDPRPNQAVHKPQSFSQP